MRVVVFFCWPTLSTAASLCFWFFEFFWPQIFTQAAARCPVGGALHRSSFGCHIWVSYSSPLVLDVVFRRFLLAGCCRQLPLANKKLCPRTMTPATVTAMTDGCCDPGRHSNLWQRFFRRLPAILKKQWRSTSAW
jgi:hypothetical protein